MAIRVTTAAARLSCVAINSAALSYFALAAPPQDASGVPLPFPAQPQRAAKRERRAQPADAPTDYAARSGQATPYPQIRDAMDEALTGRRGHHL